VAKLLLHHTNSVYKKTVKKIISEVSALLKTSYKKDYRKNDELFAEEYAV